jgi:hypothetical protein
LSQLESPDELRIRAFEFKELHSTIEHGITKAFSTGMWNSNLSLGEARGIWQAIPNEIATGCFHANGEVDIGKLKGCMAFLGKEKIVKTSQTASFPTQSLCIRKCIRYVKSFWITKTYRRQCQMPRTGSKLSNMDESF